MPNYALLNNAQHQQLRVITERGAQYGDAVQSAATFPAEFRSLQSTYPIVFAPNAEGSFDAHALFGFERGENLFLGPDGWEAAVIPLNVQRLPFLIGNVNGELQVLVDLEHPRVSATRGEPMFLSYGGASEYAEHVSSVLRTLHDGMEAGRGFVALLTELDLIESFDVDIELDDGSEHRLSGFYTINEERLLDLPGEQLARLNQAGYLLPIHMMIASLAQFRNLIQRRNRKQPQFAGF
jgi:hypothetical protein